MTGKKKCNSKSNSFVAAAEQVCLLFSLFLNTDSDEADVASPVDAKLTTSRHVSLAVNTVGTKVRRKLE